VSFQSAFPRTFSDASIRAHAPATCGVYGISNSREWILIEATEDIQADLLKHAAGQGSAAHLRPWSHGICLRGLRSIDARIAPQRAREEYVPVCNSLRALQ
jgi:hypothetical protein